MKPTHHFSRASVLLGTAAILTGPIAFADEIDIKFVSTDTVPITTTYVPFSTSLLADTFVWLNADNSDALTDIRATQRALGYREVDYKALFSEKLAWSAVTPTTAGGITTYDYSAQNNKAVDLAGFWKSKDLPILIGPDGKAYITDGHHTTAGYLAAMPVTPRFIIPGLEHVVMGHVVANYYDANAATHPAPDDAWWLARQSENNALLYGTAGNQLTRANESGYAGLQPILPSTLAMPTVPGKSSMVNSDLRALTWGMADGIVKSATNAAGTRIAGYSKASVADPNKDINFVEFYWADFLRNRVTWDNTATGSALSTTNSDRNLIAAPLSFFAAVANGIALAKSEVYRDQYGRTLGDYNSTLSSPNTKNWAADSSSAGRLAKATDTYNMFLLDNSTVTGDITPSALSAANNKLHIDTTAGQTVSGVIANFGAVEINKGGSIATQWKDAALNTAAFNSTLTIAAGAGTVTFTAANTYTGATNVGAGTLVLSGAGSVAQSSVITISAGARLDVSGVTLPFSIGAAQRLTNNGLVIGTVDVLGTVGGGGSFQNGVTLESGAHLAPGTSPGTITFANGLTLANGSAIDFEVGVLTDLIRVASGNIAGSGAGGVAVNILRGTDFVAGSTFTVLDWTGATPVGVEASDFTFANPNPGDTATFAIVGNSLQVTVVPEPGVTGLLGVGLVAGFGRRRRRA